MEVFVNFFFRGFFGDYDLAKELFCHSPLIVFQKILSLDRVGVNAQELGLRLDPTRHSFGLHKD